MNILNNTIKKKLQSVFKYFGYKLFLLLYGKIDGIIDSKNHRDIQLKKISLPNDLIYRVFTMKNCRIYTDTVTDTAFIVDQKIVDGASFQHRKFKNVNTNQNIVFQKGTPRYLKKKRGKIFSLLTGGAGNNNYFHWMYDVLPRLGLLEYEYNLKDIDHFLLPDFTKKFQKETLDLLNIPKSKRLSSIENRHTLGDTIITVDHPYVVTNDPSNNIQNIPIWIIKWLKTKFLNNLNSSKEYSKKIYIDRKDAVSGTAHLRKITNENEVKSYLVSQGYQLITLSDLHFFEQVNLFNNAESIVGLHGAGFANVTFCKPNTRILEFKPNTEGNMYKNLSINNGLNYSNISIKPEKNNNNDQYGHIKIPVKLIEDWIRQ